MNLELEEIKEFVSKGWISAITIDTVIVDGQKGNLENGLLRRLRQFKGTRTKFVMSSVILREIERHLTESAEKSKEVLEKALSEVVLPWQLEPHNKAEIESKLFSDRTPVSVAKARIAAFIDETGAETVKPGLGADIDAVFDAYFDSKPPFGKSERKRHEFPDAFALRSLEEWAKSRNTTLLAISKDKDWAAFAESSDHLVVVTDLVSALAFFQDESADYWVRVLSAETADGDKLALVKEVKKRMSGPPQALSISVKESSTYFYDENGSMHWFTYDGIHGMEEGKAFEAVEWSDGKLVVNFFANCTAHLEAFYRFKAFDAVGQKFLPNGSATFEKDSSIAVEMIATFEVVHNGARLRLAELEIPEQVFEINVGAIAPK